MIEADGFAIDGILDDATFRVPDGRVALLTGPSGCGKTLLLRALANLPLPAPARGGLRVAGLEARATAPRDLARRVALVFQDASERLPAADVAGALSLRLSALGVPPEVGEPRVAAALARLGLEAERPTWELSEGEAKRVALEAALLAEPQVLLLDEPLAGLDGRARRDVLARVASLRGRATVLVAEHRAREVEPYADRVLACEGRRVRARPEVALARA